VSRDLEIYYIYPRFFVFSELSEKTASKVKMKKSTAAPSSSSGRQLLQREAVNLFGIGKKANFGHLLAYQTKNGGNSFLPTV